MGRYNYNGLDTTKYRVPNIKEETQAREFAKLRQDYADLLGRKVDDILVDVAEEIVALCMGYTTIKGKDFTFEASLELKSKVDELLEDAEAEIQVLLEKYATAIGDNDSNMVQILLAYLTLLGNKNRNQAETLKMYMQRFRKDIEAAIAGMKDAGIGKTNAVSLIHTNIHNIKGIPSVAEAMKKPAEFQSQLIKDGGQHYDPADHRKVSGVPTNGALAVVQMTTMAMQFTWGRWQLLNFQEKGAIGYWQMRSPTSQFDCAICDAEVGFHSGDILEPYDTHARCRCIRIPIYSLR